MFADVDVQAIEKKKKELDVQKRPTNIKACPHNLFYQRKDSVFQI